MSDYTPTTEAVSQHWRCNYPDYDNTSEQFDRWLETERLAERERIIKLLEAKIDTPDRYNDRDGDSWIPDIVALIKGEKL
jgi:hypothetical protein